MRRWLVIPSIVVHVGIIVALLFLGAWHLDKLDAERRLVSIGVAPPPPPASEGSPAAKAAKPFEQKQIEDKKVMLPPTVLMGLRIAGDTQIQPAGSVRSDLKFAGHDKLTATFQVCLDASGNVASARQLKTSGYAAYDDQLKSGIA